MSAGFNGNRTRVIRERLIEEVKRGVTGYSCMGSFLTGFVVQCKDVILYATTEFRCLQISPLPVSWLAACIILLGIAYLALVQRAKSHSRWNALSESQRGLAKFTGNLAINQQRLHECIEMQESGFRSGLHVLEGQLKNLAEVLEDRWKASAALISSIREQLDNLLSTSLRKIRHRCNKLRALSSAHDHRIESLESELCKIKGSLKNAEGVELKKRMKQVEKGLHKHFQPAKVEPSPIVYTHKAVQCVISDDKFDFQERFQQLSTYTEQAYEQQTMATKAVKQGLKELLDKRMERMIAQEQKHRDEQHKMCESSLAEMAKRVGGIEVTLGNAARAFSGNK